MNLDRIRFMREYYDYSQAYIALQLQVKRGTYAAWECGSDMISIPKLVCLANLYSVRIDYLLSLTNEKHCETKNNFDSKIVGKRMKEIRMENHLSLRQMATFLNVNYSTLSKNENGISFPTTYTIYEYAKKFHYSMDWITGRSDAKKILETIK